MASYASRHMKDDEYAVLSVRFSRKNLVIRLVLAVLEYGLFCKAGGFLQAASVLAAVLLVLRPMVDFMTRELTLTDRRILGRCGYFSMKTVNLSLNEIDRTLTDRSFGGKIMGYERLTLLRTDGGKVSFDAVPDAEAVSEKIREMKERRG